MTEQVTNPSPRYLIDVTHPDPDYGTRQVRIDAESPEAAPDAARQWLAEANGDLAWHDAEATIVEGADEPASSASSPAEPPAPGEPGNVAL